MPAEELEKLELSYLNKIYDVILKELHEVLDRFYSRIKLYDFWQKQFMTSEEIKRLSDLGVGAERVLHTIFARCTDWQPSSIPVGSNLFYETDDAFINIDIKSVYVENSWDYLGVAEVGERQTSYPMKNLWGAKEKFEPQLPVYYEINDEKKPCLTYILQIIHVDIDEIVSKKYDPHAIAFILLAIPNGLLYEEYGEEIIDEPKSYHQKSGQRYRPANFRYAYHRCPWFILLKKINIEEYRVRTIFNANYFNKIFVTRHKYNKKLVLKILPEKLTLLGKNIVKRVTTVFEVTNGKIVLKNYQPE